jgi:hypothetical protein
MPIFNKPIGSHLIAIVIAPFNKLTELQHSPTLPPVNSPKVAANLYREEAALR